MTTKARASFSDMSFRPMGQDDTRLFFNSWLKSYKDAPAVKGMPSQTFHAYHHQIIEDLINKRGATPLIFCYNNKPGFIVGWTLIESYEEALVVHYVYVRKGLRGQGVAKEMMTRIWDSEEPAQAFFTHKTRDIWKWETKLNKTGWAYHPYLIHDPPKVGETARKQDAA